MPGDLFAIARVRLHQRLQPALAVVERREHQSAALPRAQQRQSLRLQGVGAHGVVDAVPFQGADGNVGHRTGLSRRNDLGGAQAFIADFSLVLGRFLRGDGLDESVGKGSICWYSSGIWRGVKLRSQLHRASGMKLPQDALRDWYCLVLIHGVAPLTDILHAG